MVIAIPLLAGLGLTPTREAHPYLAWLGGLIVFFVLAVATIFANWVTDFLVEGLFRHAFMVGAGLFFISRLIAFYGSAVKAGFL
jgi:hypothetical protein